MTTTLAPDRPAAAGPAPVPEPPAPPAHPSINVRRFLRSGPRDPAWARPALLTLLVATAVAYLRGLGASGWANAYYSAAVQAGAHSWKALFFGSTDAANFITVDKSPVFLWPMELSARLFGVNSWSILVPQALEGVAAVGILYAAVRRWFSPAAGLLAGGVMALTPVAALMFRFNNPDAMLVLLLTGAAYAMVRAIEDGRTRWLILAGSLVGVGFLAKMLQALLIVPALGLAYLVAGPPKLGRRILQLAGGIVAMVLAAGWWVVAVMVTPASARPYIGGSQNNSILNLIFGYNGFGRLTGDETGSVGGGGNGTGRWGATGLARLFNAEFGGQASWLLPAALILLLALLVLTWRSPRTGRTRAAVLLFGGWLVVTAAAISLGKGIIHPYYTVALAAPIGAVVGIGAVGLWNRRNDVVCRSILAGTVAVTAWWSSELLGRTPNWHPALRLLVLVLGFGAAAALVGLPHLRTRAAAAVATIALVAALAGPAAYSLATISTAHSGALPSAGPAGQTFGGGPGGPAGPGGPGNAGGPGGGALGAPPQGGPAGGGGRVGGILGASTPSTALTTALEADASSYTWAAATISANQAAGYQLASGEPVMAIGGFNGTDPSPTLAQFESYVTAGKIHYFIAGGMGGGPGGFGGPGGQSTASASSSITSWVESHFTSITIGGTTVYDLTAPLSS